MPKNSENSNLNEKQREAVEHKGGPLLIAAGAGSGKTKTLTSRLAYLLRSGINPEDIIAITFTNKAADEMGRRVDQLMSCADATVNEFPGGSNSSTHKLINSSTPFVGTFHSLGARILKKEAKLVNRTSFYTIFDADDSLSLLKKTMKAMDLDKEKFSPPAFHGKISQIKNELLDPTEFDKMTNLVFQKYETELAKNNAFDFDDLIEKVVKIFQDHPEVLKKYQSQFQHILVDEYQDINTAQYQLIRLLAEKHQNLSVVGDDQQAIYSFRGADFRNFLNFQNDWPNAKIVKLEENYRSSGTIVTAASEMIKNNKFQTPKTLWTQNDGGELIKVVKAADAEEEAAFVAERVNQLMSYTGATVNESKTHKLINSQTVAILYRTNAQSRAIEQSLIAAQIPYRIFGGLKFYERKEIKDLVAGLRIAYNRSDSVSKDRLEKNFDKKTAAHLIAELPRLGKELKILELINYFIVNANYLEYLEKAYKNYRERTENVNEFISFAGSFENLGEFLERVSLLQSADAPTKSQLPITNYQLPVNLMTIHLAKGLEFDTVFAIGINEGTLPHQMSYGSLDELEEERRLMYVAMTRAKKNLNLSFSGTPSRFLYEIPPEFTAFEDLTGGRENLPDEDEIYIDGF